MTDSAPAPQNYTVEYVDGPLKGQIDTRILVGGEYDKTFGVIALVDGLESNFEYTAVSTRELNGELHVSYSFDAKDSDPFVSDDDDTDLGEALV
ncbi:hypothetical protein [Subtercola sp. YIM 133946]|uniref:hypothetical protein n=1 Tax=Subtercola sp. YIM 133946 TaxID=3118909 RepID=UPI002F928B40